MAYEFQSSGIGRWFRGRQYWQGVKDIHSFADSIIAEALEQHKREKNGEKVEKKSANGKERYVFLHELIKQTSDPYTLRSELLNVLLAGRDTTAGLLANTWWVLARRPDVWEKLQAEIKTHCPDGGRPDYATIKDMKYLRYILSESLRVMPVVPGNSRTAIRDTVLPLGGGPDGKSPLFIPEGMQVLYSPWSMHRRTDYYGEDAEEFRPERWETLRPGWEYLPFNGGPRICLGQQFALLEASYVTVRLCQTFPKIEARDERDWSEWMTLTLASGVGTNVALFEQ